VINSISIVSPDEATRFGSTPLLKRTIHHKVTTYKDSSKIKQRRTYKKYPQWTVDAFAARESS
jgi:hypothetical protein